MSKLFKRSSSPSQDMTTTPTTDSQRPSSIPRSISIRFKRRSSTTPSETSSIIDQPQPQDPSSSRRKNRLSSLFKPKSNSNSLSQRDRDRSTSTPPPPPQDISNDNTTSTDLDLTSSPGTGTSSPLRRGSRPPPAPSSGLATPTRGVTSHSQGDRTPTTSNSSIKGKSNLPLGQGQGQVDAGAVEERLKTMGLGHPITVSPRILTTNIPFSKEPDDLSRSPTSSTSPTTPLKHLVHTTNDPSSSSSPSVAKTGARTRDRSTSLYSQWDYDFEQDESDSEGEVFGTPNEGLSEVEEEDEGEVVRSVKRSAGPTLMQDSVSTSIPASTSIPTSTSAPKRQPSSATIQRATIEAKPEIAHPTTAHTTQDALAYTQVDQASALPTDIQKCKQAIHLFLTSRMRQAETLCQTSDPDGTHMYIGNASAVIQAIKAMMTFDSDDLKAALEIAKTTSTLSHSMRRPAGNMAGRLAGFVRDRSGVSHVKGMNLVEKHAELIYAETLLIKAVLGIVAGGDWVGLIKEAFNMRTAYGIYRTLQAYLESSSDPDLDEHFKSGVQLGSGLSSLMLSLLPAKVMKVAEILGYAGDRKSALDTLMAAGGWQVGKKQPGIGEVEDGVRRPICDMALLSFHLVISFLMPVAGVDVVLAENILNWNMKRYPNGIFFMYFQSRLLTLQAQPEKANDILQKALMMKLEYLQLQHICLWDLGVNNLMLCHFNRSRGCFKILAQESSWSKATYLYSEAACLAEIAAAGEPMEEREHLNAMMMDVPKNLRKIAGKSLPIEKFVSRRARKFVSQGNRLLLPAIELAYFFGALPNTPPKSLYKYVIPRIQGAIDRVLASSETTYENGHGYWDDYCLAHFLLGTSLSFAAFPHEEAIITSEEISEYPMDTPTANAKAEDSLRAVLASSFKITLDHWIPYFTHYELARLYSQRGDNTTAKHHLGLILSGKPLETAPPGEKHGKYSLEGALMIKAYAGMSTLKEDEMAKMH